MENKNTPNDPNLDAALDEMPDFPSEQEESNTKLSNDELDAMLDDDSSSTTDDLPDLDIALPLASSEELGESDLPDLDDTADTAPEDELGESDLPDLDDAADAAPEAELGESDLPDLDDNADAAPEDELGESDLPDLDDAADAAPEDELGESDLPDLDDAADAAPEAELGESDLPDLDDAADAAPEDELGESDLPDLDDAADAAPEDELGESDLPDLDDAADAAPEDELGESDLPDLDDNSLDDDQNDSIDELLNDKRLDGDVIEPGNGESGSHTDEVGDDILDDLIRKEDDDDSNPMSDWNDDGEDELGDEDEFGDEDSDDTIDSALDDFYSEANDDQDVEEQVKGEDDFASLLDTIAPYENEAVDDKEDISNSVNPMPSTSSAVDDEGNKIDEQHQYLEKNPADGKNDMESSEVTSPSEDNKSPDPKKNGVIKTILLLAVLGPAFGFIGSAGYDYVKTNFIPSMMPVASNQEVLSTMEGLKGDVGKLTQKVESAQEEKNRLISDYQKLSASQDELMKEQVRQVSLISQLKSTADALKSDSDKYESEMLERLQSLLKLTTNVVERQSSQSKEIKESVLREALAVLEKTQPDDGAKIQEVARELKNSIVRLGQLEAAVTSQKSHLSLLEGETEYVKSIAQGLREKAEAKGATITPVNVNSSENESATEHANKPADFVHINKTPVKSAEVSKPKDVRTVYNLLYVDSKGNGSYDIYLQPENAKYETEFQKINVTRNKATFIAGYGRVLEVRDASHPKVPFVVVTEKGEITGRN